MPSKAGSTGKVRVATIFEPGRRMKPVWFDLDGQQVRITEVCYYWLSSVGTAQIHHYSVNTEVGLFELQFNGLDHSWTVIKKDT